MQSFSDIFWSFPSTLDEKVPVEEWHKFFLHQKHAVAFLRLINGECFQRSVRPKLGHDARLVAGHQRTRRIAVIL